MLLGMVHERPPLQWNDLPGMAVGWLQSAGGYAALGLLFWLAVRLLQRQESPLVQRWPVWLRGVFYGLTALSLGSYLIFGGLRLASAAEELADAFLTVAGAAALLAVVLPVVAELPRLRWRRIQGIAALTVRESVRGKVLWVFAILPLLLLFADWFLPHRPENQLRTFVHAVFWTMGPLLLLPAAVVAAFGIPRDLKQQTMYTIVTKPVERFEIFLGRFAGCTFLMSAALLLMTVCCLVYLGVHGVHPDAAASGWRARVPIYGDLSFRGRINDGAGVRMREWGYRRHIAGGPSSNARAVWAFETLPTERAGQATVPCEFHFDILRMSKSPQEGKGVFCTLTVQTWQWRPEQLPAYERELARLQAEQRGKPQPATPEELRLELAGKFGYCEFPSKEVFDQTTFSIDVPSALFRKAQEGYEPVRQEAARNGQPAAPPLTVVVKCDSPTQFLGMARHDLYFVEDECSFAANFFKCALGIWFRLCLMIGVATALSTYLSGVVSLVTVLFLYGAGLWRPYIQNLATNRAESGPADALLRLANRLPMTAKQEETAVTRTAGLLDEVFRWCLQRILNLFPDVGRFDLADHVAEGFDISGGTLVMCVLLLLGYVLPWVVLGFYALKSREIAS
ncbi:MAG: hypothetical protein JNM56_22310 [Planctomycetia bacterium]|nr:hypothetical protein [Planctomycetia bacterium]